MAHAVTSPPMLRLRRSTQSGTKAAAAIGVAYTVFYTESCTMAYIFSGAVIDLSNMAAGDVINLRVRKIVVPGGAWVNHDLVNYAGAMPAGHVTAHITPIPDVYGVEVAINQTAGVLRNIDAEFYDAKRIGLP